MEFRRKYERRPMTAQSNIAMSIAKFETLDRMDLNVRPIDISQGGMCIEADVQLDPGFVWFREGVDKHRCGITVWTRPGDNHTCRAGIKFISLESEQ